MGKIDEEVTIEIRCEVLAIAECGVMDILDALGYDGGYNNRIETHYDDEGGFGVARTVFVRTVNTMIKTPEELAQEASQNA